jgi:hypothetical protein
VLDVFHTLAEVSVAITGFSSLIIIFRGSSSDWSRQEYVSFAYVLSWSIGCIFLSLLPIVLVEFDVKLSSVARVGLFTAIAYMFAVGWILTSARNQIAKESEGDNALWRSATGGGRVGFGMSLSFLVIVAGAFAAGLGFLPGPQHAWYAVTIVLLMAHATAELGFFVMQTTRRDNSE